jgi:PKD domain-containing protein
MRKMLARRRLYFGAGFTAAVAAVLALAGCGLDEIKIPEMDGPAELGTSLRLTAVPDVITADGFSTSLVTVQLRDQNGRALAGRDIFFAVADSAGRFADVGSFRTSNGPGTGATVRTDASGVASIVYSAPARTDATANQTVLITARPVSNDFEGQIYRTVRIELRSAEPRLFAPNPDNALPSCGIVVEVPSGSCAPPTPIPAPTATPTPGPLPTATPTAAPPPGGGCRVRVNTSVLFQSRSFDPDGTIVRYFWDFGNGRQTDSPDGATSYSRPGSYTVSHVVTDNNGAQSACQTTIAVQ